MKHNGIWYLKEMADFVPKDAKMLEKFFEKHDKKMVLEAIEETEYDMEEIKETIEELKKEVETW